MNWSIFKDELMIRVNELRESELNSNEEIDEFVLILTNNLIECCEKSMKIKRKFNRSVPWWTEEIKMMRGEVKRIRKRYQRSYDENIRTNMREEYLMTER